LPSLEKLHQEFKGEPFVLIGIDLQEKRETVRKYIRKNGLSFLNVLDSDGQVAALFGVTSTPVKFLIDSEGNMIAAALGYRDWEQPEFKALLKELIRQAK
jgi:peroxiredoxin